MSICNKILTCSVLIKDKILILDRLESGNEWKSVTGIPETLLETDADFRFQVVWAGWRAPGKVNNADNAVLFSKKDFVLLGHEVHKHSDGSQELILLFKGVNNPFELKIMYDLGKNAFYIRRRLAIRDSDYKHHFLQWVWPRYGFVDGDFKALKRGGFGQPLVLGRPGMAVFLGLEYPAAVNKLIAEPNRKVGICCGQVMGKPVGKDWIVSEWVVQALTPQRSVKTWFMNYLDDIRVAPLKPYILYNTWYDLRAPEMVKKAENILNEENVMRIVKLFEDNLVKPFGLSLNAFVLDDGWDVYRSDWVLRKKEFPGGLKPISDRLTKTGTDLGIWFGPTGGYSNREWRVNWMADQGYEVVGDQLCLAGERYKRLLKKRVLDFVRNEKIGYFKWDGIQFLCNEPDHGHPPGIYSRRAVMESLIDLCASVRQADPDIFLNVTSGTWLSPWWVKYANTIWMQGDDYGYADVPSISRRDRAMTYRDYVLFDGLRKNDFWFPISNLMTHGIIKGHLQKLGGESEPLDKFTDNALLYVARGVAMWELYVSPDLLSQGEWKAIGESIKWAKDRFPLLMSTEMVGGNPGKREAYGYVHASGNRVIMAVRNPFIKPSVLSIHLNSRLGLDRAAKQLVLERTYPSRRIAPHLVNCGEEIHLPLMGFETAVYELYPLSDSSLPLLADAIFQVVNFNDNHYEIQVLETGNQMRILNPEKVKILSSDGKSIDVGQLNFTKELSQPVLFEETVQLEEMKNEFRLKVMVDVHPTVRAGYLAVLLEDCEKKRKNSGPGFQVVVDGNDFIPQVEEQKGNWIWIQISVPSGRHFIHLQISPPGGEKYWEGIIGIWFIAKQICPSSTLLFEVNGHPVASPMPPKPWPAGVLKRIIPLDEIHLKKNDTGE